VGSGAKKCATLLLSENALVSMPASFGSTLCDSLRVIYLDHNKLEKFPSALCAAKNLIKIHLEHNKVTSVPEEIKSLGALKKLYLQGNEIQSLPASIGSLTSLEVLNVADNALTLLPHQLIKCVALTQFDASNNPLVAPLPFVLQKGYEWLRLYLAEVSASATVGVPTDDEFLFYRSIELSGPTEAPAKMPSVPKGAALNASASRGIAGDDSALELKQNTFVSYFFCDSSGYKTQGHRNYMEDRCMLVPRYRQRTPESALEELENLFSKTSFYGVYDGHGGWIAAEFLSRHLHRAVVNQVAFAEGRFRDALHNAFIELDNTLIRWLFESRHPEGGGSTAVTALIVDNRLIVAHCGDSRAVLSRKKKALRMSEDHKPFRSDELDRIHAAGGTVVHVQEAYRVNGQLAVSRSFGDLVLKGQNVIIADPEFHEELLTPDDDCLVLASDGLWDVINDQKAVDVARKASTAMEAAQKLVELALKKESSDNITVVVVKFKWTAEFLAGVDSSPADGVRSKSAASATVDYSKLERKNSATATDVQAAKEGKVPTLRGTVGDSSPRVGDDKGGASSTKRQQVTLFVPDAKGSEPFSQLVTPQMTAAQLLEAAKEKHSLTGEQYSVVLVSPKDRENGDSAKTSEVLKPTTDLSAMRFDALSFLILQAPGTDISSFLASGASGKGDSSVKMSKEDESKVLDSFDMMTFRRGKQKREGGRSTAQALVTDEPAPVAPEDYVNFDDMPSGWGEAMAPDGRKYYFHLPTRETSWKHPRAQAPADWHRAVSLDSKVYFYKDEMTVTWGKEFA
jgi:protein phosphatase 1L